MTTTHLAFAALPAQTQEKLADLSDAVSCILPSDVRSWRIDVSALPLEPNSLEIFKEVSDWVGKSKACLYYFESLAKDIDLAEVERVFAVAKAHEANDRAYPRLNKRGHSFYVGSSQSMAKRFKEHLGYGASRTYALQLIHWAQPLGVQLEFVCAKYPDDTAPNVIQALEDTLWQKRKPMFGRMGSK